jgi:pectate lyase
MVFEDGRPLGPPHSSHEEIRRFGEGRFSHWGGQIYFSASDNSNPAHNGRCYSVEEVAR